MCQRFYYLSHFNFAVLHFILWLKHCCRANRVIKQMSRWKTCWTVIVTIEGYISCSTNKKQLCNWSIFIIKRLIWNCDQGTQQYQRYVKFLQTEYFIDDACHCSSSSHYRLFQAWIIYILQELLNKRQDRKGNGILNEISTQRNSVMW